MFDGIDRGIEWVVGTVVTLMMATMTVVIGLEVFFRYILTSALPWPEEVARYLMIWITCLGAGLAIRYGDHVAVEFVLQRMPPPLRRSVLFAGRLLILLFLALVVVFGAEMTAKVSHQRSAAMEISMSVPYLALPVGGVLMIYQLLVLMLRKREMAPPMPPVA